jgi:uncharacterized protein YjiS (DUF1127 family)
MTAKIPVLPIAGATVLRAALALIAFVTHWLKQVARARRHRREAHALAGLDRYMLADIGITRSDLNDAFSQPFWEDPTELLSERAGERRRHRPRAATRVTLVGAPDEGFHRPSLDRPARQAI